MRRAIAPVGLSVLVSAALAVPAAAVPTYREHTRITQAGEYAQAVGVGDVNGDGRDDVAIYDYGACDVHVVFGRDASGTVALGDLGTGGLTIRGAGSTSCEVDVNPAGDVNGDGRADVAIGMRYGNPARGWVVFGRPAGGDVDLSTLGAGGLMFRGTPQPGTGQVVPIVPDGALGDVNGDGLGDLRVLVTRPEGGGFGPAVFFGRATGGTVEYGDGSGLLRVGIGPRLLTGLFAYSDLDRNGRTDLVTWDRDPSSGHRFDLVGGRGAAGVDLAAGGPSIVPLTGGGYVEPDGLDYVLDPQGDIDGDGVPDLHYRQYIGSDLRTSANVALSSRQASPLTKTSLLAGSLVLAGSATLNVGTAGRAGDVDRDGRDDLTVAATSRSEIDAGDREFLTAFPEGRGWGYLVNGRATPGTLSLDTPPAGVSRLDSLPDATLFGALRFDADTDRELLARDRATGDIVVGDVVDQPAPADTEAPSLDGLTLDHATISNRIPCGGAGESVCPAPRDATVSFTASEPVKVRFRLVSQYGWTALGATVWTGRGARTIALRAAYVIPAGWLRPRPEYHRLPLGNYTLRVEARDLAGRTTTVTRALKIVS